MTLNEWLQKTGTTQAALARQLGVSHSAVSKWCDGRRPDWPQLEAIYAATGGAVQPNDWLHPAPQLAAETAA